MAAPTSTDTFLDVLRKSNLLAGDRLNEYLAGVPGAEKLPPTDLAGRMVRDALITPFQANHLLKGRYKNFFIGKFKVLEPLGTGGMSQVFLCEHAAMRHRVALKMLPIKESTDPVAVNRFLREARAAAAVNHPNVVRAHDFDHSDGKFYYLIMDYVDGVNLHDLIKHVGPLPPEVAANYISQAAAGLQHIADSGLIHRDLKPSNLLLDKSGLIRILDLGLARFTEDDKDNITRQFQNNTVMGTADYLAPEQALMMDRIDVRADIYALGATFYFLLSGKAPFEDASVTQKLLAHQLREPEPIAGLPKKMQAVVRKMMMKNPDDRYAHPADVADALAPWTADGLPPPDESFFPRRGLGGAPSTSGGRTKPPSTTGSGGTLAGATFPPSFSGGPRTGGPRSAGAGRSSSTSDIMTARTGPLPVTAPSMKARARRRGLLVAGGAAVLTFAAVAVVLAVVNPFGKPKDTAGVVPPPAGTAKLPDLVPPVVKPAPPADGPPPPAGALVVAAAGEYKTVQAAVARAKPGQTIVLTDAEYADPLFVEAPAANVTVTGWPLNRPVKWKAPVRVRDADGFTLANIHFVGAGVTVAGKCPGLKLENLTATGFPAAAVTLAGCSGTPGSEIRVVNLRAGLADGVGVAVSAPDGVPTKHVVIDRCRFDPGLTAGVDIAGPAEAVTVSFSRFIGTRNGVSVSAASDPPKVSLTVTNNTFAQVSGVGIALAAIPPAGSAFTVTNNLFFETRQMTSCGAVTGVPAGEPAVWVWHDEGLESTKETSIPAGSRYFRKAFDLPAPPPADARLEVGGVASFKVWLNGDLVGESTPKHFTKRVFLFPLAGKLKAGKNVIAVEGVNTLDPIEPGFAVAAGMTCRVTRPGTPKPLVTTDDTWKSNATADDGWQKPAFADADWKPVKPWVKSSYNLPFLGSIWDSVVADQLGAAPPVTITAAGNVRDYKSSEGYPRLDSLRGIVLAKTFAGADPDADATYFRTPRTGTRLASVGTNGGPVGVPVEK